MENKKTPITINDVEYQFEDMTQEQQTLINHVADLIESYLLHGSILTNCRWDAMRL